MFLFLKILVFTNVALVAQNCSRASVWKIRSCSMIKGCTCHHPYCKNIKEKQNIQLNVLPKIYSTNCYFVLVSLDTWKLKCASILA